MTWTVSIDVDRKRDVPLTRQVQQGLRSRIEDRVLLTGTRLPSTRQLAADLGVSRSVAVEAYEQLAAEGYLQCLRGSGTVVATRRATTPISPVSAASTRVRKVEWDLRAGRSSVVNFPRTEWLACYRAAVSAADHTEFDYPAPLGHPMVREEIAKYLGRVREVRSDPDAVMTTSGFAQGLSLLCEVLPRLGIDLVAVEDPGHTAHSSFIRQAGVRTVPVPVDEQGIDVACLAASGARAVLVTPGHQFPTGGQMSPQRREELIRWAGDVDGLIIEDDYDGDLWFDAGTRYPALQSLDPARVVYAGTASRSLAPGLRLGWLVLPARMIDAMRLVRSRRDLGMDSITQRAFAEFLRSGVMDRHLRRVRSRYRSRRRMLVDALQMHVPMATVVGAEAGIHIYLEFPEWVDEAALVRAALRRSVLVNAGQDFRRPGGGRPPALVVSYAAVPPSTLAQSAQQLGAALTEQWEQLGSRS